MNFILEGNLKQTVLYTYSTIMNFILEGKLCFTETKRLCRITLFILFLYFRFLINILLLTDNAKHELNNVGSLSPERTVLRADSRLRALAKESSINGQGIVLGVVCHRR